MKTTVTALASLLALATHSFADERVELRDVPAEVLKALLVRSGGAQFRSLSRESEGDRVIYEATWKSDGRTYEAEVDSTGAILEVETEIKVKDLPAAVRKRIKQIAGEDAEIEEVEKVTVVIYEVELEKDGKEIELRLNAVGEVLGGEPEGR